MQFAALPMAPRLQVVSYRMQRTILSVAYPLTDVGIDAVGGSEQILTMLDTALTTAGHRSLVIAAEGSRIGAHA